MPTMFVVGVGGVVAASAVAAFVAGDYVLERRRVNRSLRRLSTAELNRASGAASASGAARSAIDGRARRLAAPVSQRVLLPGLRRVAGRLRGLAPAGVLDRLRDQLNAAGNPHGWDAERVFAAKVVAAVAGLLCGILLAVASGQPPLRASLVVAVVAFVGYQVPEWMVKSRASERQTEIQRALADSLDLLSITVRAGLGFDAAVDRVADQTRGPLGDELRRLLREMQLGKSRIAALRGLAARNDVAELTSFVLAMVQADSFGIAVSSVLDVQSNEMRLKRRQRAEEQAHKVPVKILFPVLFCVFPSLFLVLLGPAAIQLYRNLIA